MQKLIGSILVLTATAGAGYLYGEGLKDYLRQMEYLRYIAGMIRGQLEYTGAPLQEQPAHYAQPVADLSFSCQFSSLLPDHSAVVEQGRGYEYQSDF